LGETAIAIRRDGARRLHDPVLVTDMRIHASTLAAAALLGLPTAGLAQETSPKVIDIVNKTAAEEGLFQFDWGMPASPSLSLLGHVEDKVPAANSLKAFTVQLPSMVGGDEIGQTIGVDVSPAWLIGDGGTRTYTRYLESSPSYRALYRSRIGLAAYEGNARRSRLILGLSTSLLDSSDPLMARLPGESGSAWQTCLDSRSAIVQADLDKVSDADQGKRQALQTELAGLIQEQPVATEKVQAYARKLAASPNDDGVIAVLTLATLDLKRIVDRRAVIDAELKTLTVQADTDLQKRFTRSDAADIVSDCARRANVVARYGESLSVGAGASWAGSRGNLDNLQGGGWAAWASYRRPLGFDFGVEDGDLIPRSYWMWGGSVRYGMNEPIRTGALNVHEAKGDTINLWLGVERLTASSRLAIEGGWQLRHLNDVPHGPDYPRERWRYFVSYSKRLGDERSGVWLRLGYGNADDGALDDQSIVASLVYAPPAAANLLSTK
jgi:hypothetical protein